MMKLDIAVGASRHQKVWNNEQWSWVDLVKRLAHTHRTPETFETYAASDKGRQAEIKDVGGFVGGYLIDGTRKPAFVQHRQILALDIDMGYPDLWEDFTMYFSCAAAIYSTHAHSLGNPRFRVILPLSRPVGREEYEAIGRKVSSYVGMRHFDPTTFQAERLMYWPSTSKDGDYYFQEQRGPWLEVDNVLGRYRDWKNISEWPLCPSEVEIVKTGLKQQEDPLEKEGLIGAFCRTYDIHEAISKFLSEKYAPCGGDRYTFTEGSTAAGAIAYDERFLYSHHSTDPAGGILCNAFDLVRLHKFGHLDKDTSLSIGKRESFQRMSHLAQTDSEVIKELGIFTLGLAGAPEDTEWLKDMDTDRKGKYLGTINNFTLILQNDPALKGAFAYSGFDHRDYSTRKLPWTKDPGSRELNDRDESGLRQYFEKKYDIYHVTKSLDAFQLIVRQNAFHPIRDYLRSLVWDGTPRLDRLFIDQLGARDTDYTRAVTRKALVAAVARVMQPGVKFDYMITFVGQQGKGKSSLIYDLGNGWASDTLDSVTGKEAYMQLQGAWLIEMAELSSMRSADVEAVKHFITKREDRFRVTFGKRSENFKRQNVFFGSTNVREFLRDPTGNRRFWPVVTSKKYVPGSLQPDQYWAEAMYRYQAGETLFLTDDMEIKATEVQYEHAERDERIGLIEKYLDMKLPADWEEMGIYQRVSHVGSEPNEMPGVRVRDKVCVAEIWVERLGNKIQDMNVHNTKFIHSIMRNMPGWELLGSTRSFSHYGYQRAYVRTNTSFTKTAEVAEQHWLN